MTRVVGYVRVSSERQAQTGLSLEAQTAKLQAYATAMDLELVEIVVEPGKSAGSLNRPGLQRALTMLETGEVTGLLIAKLDRLTRDLSDFATLVKKYFQKHELLSVSDSIDTRSATGRLILNILVTVSQWERERGGERTREALQALRARGVVPGPKPIENASTGRIREMAAMGVGYREIARRLTAEGVPAPRGGAWRDTTVRKVARRHHAV